MDKVIINGVEYVPKTEPKQDDGCVKFKDLKIGDIFSYEKGWEHRMIKTEKVSLGNGKANCIFFSGCAFGRGVFGYCGPEDKVFLIERYVNEAGN